MAARALEGEIYFRRSAMEGLEIMSHERFSAYPAFAHREYHPN